MTSEQVRIPAAPAATGAQPAWVGDEVVARHHLAPRRVRGMVPGLTKVRDVRVPRGVVGVISPWNHPLYLGLPRRLGLR